MARGLLIDRRENEDTRMTPRPITSPAAHIHGARHAAQAADPSADPSSGANFAQLIANSGLSATNFVALHQNGDLGNLAPDTQSQGKSNGNNGNNGKDAGTSPAAASQAAPAPQTPDNASSVAGQTATDATTAAAQAAAIAAALAAQAAQNGAAKSAPANPASPSGANPQLLPAPGVDPTQAANQNSAANAPAPPGAADLNARIVAGTPDFLSQSSTVFAGLWHHAGDAAAKGAAQDATGNSDTGSDTAASDTSNTGSSATQNNAPAKTAATDGPATAALHDALNASLTAGASDPSTGAPPPASAAGDTQTSQPPLAAPLQTVATSLTPVSPNPVVPAAMTIMPPLDQVAFSLKQAAQNGTDRIEIQLKPASLGAIDVKLDLTHDGKVTAVISADRSDTLNMLRQDADQLQQALRDAGLQADSNSLSFNLRNDQQSLPQQSSSAPGIAADSADGTLAGTSAAPAPRFRRHDGALDIQV
jgi:flagellar hook-length control protein FliK